MINDNENPRNNLFYFVNCFNFVHREGNERSYIIFYIFIINILNKNITYKVFGKNIHTGTSTTMVSRFFSFLTCIARRLLRSSLTRIHCNIRTDCD